MSLSAKFMMVLLTGSLIISVSSCSDEDRGSAAVVNQHSMRSSAAPLNMDPRICDLAEVSLSSDGKPITASDTTVIQATPGTPIDITATIAANPARYTVGYVRVELLEAGYSVYPGEGTPTSGTLIADTLPTLDKVIARQSVEGPTVAGLSIPGAAALATGNYQVGVVVQSLAGPSCPGANDAYISTVAATIHWAAN